MRFEFGDIVVDAEQVKLTKHANQLEFEPRVFELLVYFCQHPQEAVARETLVEQVWGGRIVSDAAVNRAVGELRKLIEDNPSSPQWIKTVSKVGYRLAVTPSLHENNGLSNQAHHSNTQAPSPQAESAKIEVKPTAVTPVNTRLFPSKKAQWITLVVGIALLITLIYQSLGMKTPTETFKVIGRQPVTSTMGNAFNAFFHASTHRLLYIYRADADANAQLYIQYADGSSQAISHDNYYYTDVLHSDDGFIYATRLNNLQQRHCEIVKLDLLTKRIEPILSCGERVVTQLVIDEKKRRLIYQSRASISAPYAVYSYQLDTGRKQQITHPLQMSNNTGDYAFALSPNSQTLAVVEYSADEIDHIKLIDLKNNSIIVSAPFIDQVYGLIWRSEQQILASNGDGLFAFEPGNLTLTVKEYSDQFGRLSLGYDSDSILTDRSQTTINIFSYFINQAALSPLTKNSGINLNPILGNHSNVLAFTSNRTGKEQIYLQFEGKPAAIAKFDGAISYISAMAWSPKDNELVASINNFLYRYSVENHHWQNVAEQFTQVHHVSYIEDTILFSAEIDGQWNIWQLALKDNQVTQITTKGGYSVQGVGNMVYFTKFNHDGLYQLDVKTGLESVLIKGFPISGWRHWQLRNDKIYYLRDKTYKALDLKTGRVEIIHNFAGRTPSSCNMSFQQDFFACEKVESTISNIWKIQLSRN